MRSGEAMGDRGESMASHGSSWEGMEEGKHLGDILVVGDVVEVEEDGGEAVLGAVLDGLEHLLVGRVPAVWKVVGHWSGAAGRGRSMAGRGRPWNADGRSMEGHGRPRARRAAAMEGHGRPRARRAAAMEGHGRPRARRAAASDGWPRNNIIICWLAAYAFGSKVGEGG